MEKGKIKKIKIFFEKGTPPKTPVAADCVADLGLAGDRYAKGGDRQLTAIDTESLDWMETQTEKGLCFDRYKANLEVENLDLSALKSGDKLVCGEVLLEVSSAHKECFAECVLVQNCTNCSLRRHAKYLKVLKSGTIRIDDEISEEL